MAKAKPHRPDNEIAAGRPGSLAFRRQICFWLAAAGCLRRCSSMSSAASLLPFVAGMALAYFLDPVADRLQRLGLSRAAATLLILIAFIVISHCWRWSS